MNQDKNSDNQRILFDCACFNFRMKQDIVVIVEFGLIRQYKPPQDKINYAYQHGDTQHIA